MRKTMEEKRGKMSKKCVEEASHGKARNIMKTINKEKKQGTKKCRKGRKKERRKKGRKHTEKDKQKQQQCNKGVRTEGGKV